MGLDEKFLEIFESRNVAIKFKHDGEQVRKEVDCFFEIEGNSIKIAIERKEGISFDAESYEFSLYDRNDGSTMNLNCEVCKLDIDEVSGYVKEIEYKKKGSEFNFFGANLLAFLASTY